MMSFHEYRLELSEGILSDMKRWWKDFSSRAKHANLEKKYHLATVRDLIKYADRIMHDFKRFLKSHDQRLRKAIITDCAEWKRYQKHTLRRVTNPKHEELSHFDQMQLRRLEMEVNSIQKSVEYFSTVQYHLSQDRYRYDLSHNHRGNLK